MKDVPRRNALKLAAVATVGLSASPASATPQNPVKYEKATVEWADTSDHGTVALRLADGQAHFVAGIDPKTLMIAIVAGMNGWTVDFTSKGVGGPVAEREDHQGEQAEVKVTSSRLC